jgi:hypothetical protein
MSDGRVRPLDPSAAAPRHETAGVDQRDAIRQALGVLNEVGHDEDRDTAVADVLEELPRIAPGLRVEAHAGTR